MKKFIGGIITGVALSCTVAFAVNYTAEPNTFPIKLNGSSINMEGYNINGYTYFKLRDIADNVDGLYVRFASNNTIMISTGDYNDIGEEYDNYNSTEPNKTQEPQSIPTVAPEIEWITNDELYSQYEIDFNAISYGYYGSPYFYHAWGQYMDGIMPDSAVIFKVTEYPRNQELELNKEYTFNGIRMKKVFQNKWKSSFYFAKQDLISKGIISY